MEDNEFGIKCHQAAMSLHLTKELLSAVAVQAPDFTLGQELDEMAGQLGRVRDRLNEIGEAYRA